MALKDRIIEEGKCELKIFDSLNLDDNQQCTVDLFTTALFNAYLNEGDVHTETWADVFSDEKLFYNVCKILHNNRIATFEVVNNTARCYMNKSFIDRMFTEDEIQSLRLKYKWNKNKMKYFKPYSDSRVKINNHYTETGLVRKGFMKQGSSKFKYDLKYLNKYLDEIIEEVYKANDTSTKDITYEEIVEEITNYYAISDDWYTLGQCNIDSRGRAIYQASSKVLNPVTHKVARALIVLPNSKKLNKELLPEVYRAIAELFSYRAKTLKEREDFGYNQYVNKILPDELEAKIWCERLYERLDNLDEPWDVPVELDVTSSVLSVESLLLNDHKLMDQVNLINPEELHDAWTLDYVSRKHVKKACTPMLYGSGKTPNELWDKAKLEYNQQQLNLMMNEITNGRFKTANDFKSYIIKNVEPRSTMEVNIWGTKFKIYCNRFKWEVMSRKTYYLFDSSQQKVKCITRDISMVPNLEQFKRYFVTLLV